MDQWLRPGYVFETTTKQRATEAAGLSSLRRGRVRGRSAANFPSIASLETGKSAVKRVTRFSFRSDPPTFRLALIALSNGGKEPAGLSGFASISFFFCLFLKTRRGIPSIRNRFIAFVEYMFPSNGNRNERNFAVRIIFFRNEIEWSGIEFLISGFSLIRNDIVVVVLGQEVHT